MVAVQDIAGRVLTSLLLHREQTVQIARLRLYSTQARHISLDPLRRHL